MPRVNLSRKHKRDLSSLCELTLQEQLRKTDEAHHRLHVPKLRDHVMEHAGLHFHFNPDLIIGLRGASRFEFIQEHPIIRDLGDYEQFVRAAIAEALPSANHTPLQAEGKASA